jgi:hypothetical protein
MHLGLAFTERGFDRVAMTHTTRHVLAKACLTPSGQRIFYALR